MLEILVGIAVVLVIFCFYGVIYCEATGGCPH